MKKLNQAGMGIIALVGAMTWSMSAQAMAKKKVEQEDSGTIVIVEPPQEQTSDGFRFGVPSYGGTGCPAGSIAITLDALSSEILLPLDQYATASGNGRTLDRATCNIAIPVMVSSGYQVAIDVLEIQGEARVLNEKAHAQVSAETFFAGTTGPVVSQNLSGHLGSFVLTGDLTEGAQKWSACGAQVIARVNSAITQFSGDAADFVVQVKLKLIEDAECR